MSSLAVLLLCIQACLVQNTFAACFGAYNTGPAAHCAAGLAGPYAGFAGSYAAPFAAPFGAAIAEPFGYAGYPYEYGVGSAYGGSGIGNVAVAGELPVGGATSVIGQIPILGAVEYAGPVAAAGAVTIAGNCGCGAAPAYNYG